MTFIQLTLLDGPESRTLIALNVNAIMAVWEDKDGTFITCRGNSRPDRFEESYKDVIKLLRLYGPVGSINTLKDTEIVHRLEDW